MKRLYAVILGLLCAASAQAQYTIQSTTLNGGTNNVAASTTATMTAPVLSFTRSTYGTVQASYVLTGAGTSAVVFTFDESLDGTTWVPSTRTLSVTASGTTAVSGLSNYLMGGSGYLRLKSVNNANATAVTNLAIKFSYKSGI